MEPNVSLGVTGRKPRFAGIAATALLTGCLVAFASVRPAMAGGQAGAGAAPQGARPADPHANNGRGGPPQGPWEWWNDPEVQKELALSADKIKRIDDYFERRSKDMKPMVDKFQHEREVLDAMTQAATVDEATYALQVQEVQSLGARIGESRTMMLYRIYRELQPDQYKKLQEIIARHYGRSNSPPPSASGNGGRGRE